MKIVYPSVMLWNTLCARPHDTIHNYFINNIGKTKNRELKVFPYFSLFPLLFSNKWTVLALECKLIIMGLGSLSWLSMGWLVHGFIAPVFIFFKRIGWTVYWPFNMAEWKVVAAILLDVNVRRNAWSKDVHNTTFLASFFFILLEN